MKKVKLLSYGVVFMGLSILLTGCYGSFGLTKKVYQWNGTIGNKFVNEAVFLGLNIIPVYGVATFIDGVFLNTVEFWTGKNPVALNPGENNFKYNGKNVKLVLTENHAVIYHKGEVEATLDYNNQDKSWYITEKGETHRYMSVEGNVLTAYSPSGLAIDKKVATINN